MPKLHALSKTHLSFHSWNGHRRPPGPSWQETSGRAGPQWTDPGRILGPPGPRPPAAQPPGLGRACGTPGGQRPCISCGLLVAPASGAHPRQALPVQRADPSSEPARPLGPSDQLGPRAPPGSSLPALLSPPPDRPPAPLWDGLCRVRPGQAEGQSGLPALAR